VDTTFDLLAHDLLTATFWLDVRKTQDGSREFGAAPTAAWLALRKLVPLLPPAEVIPTHSRAMTAAAFLRSTPASTFYAGSAPMPRSSENR
jgi:histidine ammonia-lyase